MKRPNHILLVEDNPADADLTSETLAECLDVDISLAKDGVEALEILNNDGSWSAQGRPTLILLDLNLPGKDGRQVLAVLKTHALLRRIPVVILSSSDSDRDITSCYELGANCFITKPLDLQAFRDTVRMVEQFWLGRARLPRRDGHTMETRIGAGL
jgi:two-component system, chemotaxis family, response regulator Rcp1